MATITTSTNSANLPSEYYNKVVLTVFDETLQLVPLGKKYPQPENTGKVAKWLIYSKLSANTTALTEGIVPADTSITTTNVSVTLAQYGGYAKVSDFMDMTAVDPVLENVLEREAKQGALSLDTLVRNELDTNGQDQFANGKANLAATGAGDVFTSKECLKAAITLKKLLVTPYSGNDFVVVAHSASIGDMMNDTNIGSWTDLNKYIDPSSKRPFNGELGKVFMTRVLESQNISSTTTGTLGSATVYSNLFLGEQPFGVASLNAKNLKAITKPHGSGGSLDPLNQIATVGWKADGFAAKYFGNIGGNPHRVIKIRCGSAY